MACCCAGVLFKQDGWLCYRGTDGTVTKLCRIEETK